MAQLGVQLYRETFSCSICLELLKDPVTVPCGHSYCRDCIQTHWDAEEHDGLSTNSCPQCRQSFDTRPVLVKNTMLADLVEQLKKTGLQAAPADHCYAGPEDVACDFCTGRKRKTLKSCLQCVASYCETHLQPHYGLPVFKKHKLVEPSKNLQENLCPRHDEVMKMFCRTDQQSICYLCSMDKHKGHDTVSAAAERTERQRELEESRLNIQQRITDAEKDVKLLQQEVKAIDGSADKAVEHSEKTFTQMIRLIQRTSSDVKQQLRDQQDTDVSRVRDLQEKLEKEIAELKRRDSELKTLAQHDDHNKFLQNYHSLSALCESTSSIEIERPPRCNENVTEAVSEAREKLQDVLTKISCTLSQVDVSLTHPEPKTREDFLRYARDITLDPNTAHNKLYLSEGNRRAERKRKALAYPDHPDRFTKLEVVMSEESLTGRCYWEVKWLASAIQVTVAYKNVGETLFGFNDKSWSLQFCENRYQFFHNKVITSFPGPQSNRIGVYLDHSAGVLAFYDVSETLTMTLLHRAQATFTGPLHAAVELCWGIGGTAEFIKLK